MMGTADCKTANGCSWVASRQWSSCSFKARGQTCPNRAYAIVQAWAGQSRHGAAAGRDLLVATMATGLIATTPASVGELFEMGVDRAFIHSHTATPPHRAASVVPTWPEPSSAEIDANTINHTANPTISPATNALARRHAWLANDGRRSMPRSMRAGDVDTEAIGSLGRVLYLIPDPSIAAAPWK